MMNHSFFILFALLQSVTIRVHSFVGPTVSFRRNHNQSHLSVLPNADLMVMGPPPPPATPITTVQTTATTAPLSVLLLDQSTASPWNFAQHTGRTITPEATTAASSSVTVAVQEYKTPTAEELANKKMTFNMIFWGGGFVAPFLATVFYFGARFWER